MKDSPTNLRGSDSSKSTSPILGEERLSIWSRPSVQTATCTIALAIVGSAVWELIAKPGLGSVGRFLLSVATFGSTRVRDVAYESAALDPSPLVGLLVLGIISSLPAVFAQYVWTRAFRRARRRNALDEEIRAVEEAHSTTEERHQAVMQHLRVKREELDKRLSRIGVVGLIYAASLSVTALVTFGIINEATAVRRVFFANLATIGPYISDAEEELIKSRFAQVRTKDAYESIESSMMNVASANRVELRKIGSVR